MNRFLLLMFISLPSYSAGFDCTLATTHIERTICSNEELSSLDSELNQIYKNNVVENPALKQEQRNWMKNVRNKIVEPQDLIVAYQTRISEISKLSNDNNVLVGDANQRKGLNQEKVTGESSKIDSENADEIMKKNAELIGMIDVCVSKGYIFKDEIVENLKDVTIADAKSKSGALYSSEKMTNYYKGSFELFSFTSSNVSTMSIFVQSCSILNGKIEKERGMKEMENRF